jgi:hypothetical protein
MRRFCSFASVAVEEYCRRSFKLHRRTPFRSIGECCVTREGRLRARSHHLTYFVGVWVNSAAFSPDSRHIVTASVDRSVRVWNAVPGPEIAVLPGHQGVVGSAIFSPDGTRIVTASDDGTAQIWDTNTKAQIALLRGHEDRVYDATFSADGRLGVTALRDCTARILESLSFLDPVDRARAKASQAQALSRAQECELFLRVRGC